MLVLDVLIGIQTLIILNPSQVSTYLLTFSSVQVMWKRTIET